jgi:hypothetical protein
VTTEAERCAVAAFPPLQRLIDLRDAGWAFLPSVVDGVITEVRGVRAWAGGWADAVRIRYTTDAGGLRCDPAGGVVWNLEGGLTDVIDGLMALPRPGAPAAPVLAKGRAPQLWIP